MSEPLTQAPWLLPLGQTIWIDGEAVDPIAEIQRLKKAKNDLREEIASIVRRADQRAKIIHGPEDRMIGELCERMGYGAVMDAASRLWQRKDARGAFVIGGGRGALTSLLKRIRKEK